MTTMRACNLKCQECKNFMPNTEALNKLPFLSIEYTYIVKIFDILSHSDAPGFAVIRKTAGTSQSNGNSFPKNIYSLKSCKRY